MKFYDFNPKDDGTVAVTVPIEDMGNGEGFLSVHFGEDEISILVSDMDDGEEMYGITYTYEDFCNFIEARDFQVAMLAKAKELQDAVGRHPSSQPRFQVIDGGGKETK